MPLFRLHKNDFSFPSPSFAEPDGLLAVGGDLSPARLLEAYRLGIFPWYSEKDPLLWWSPDPRLILFPESVNCSRSLRKTLQKFSTSPDCEIRIDTAFSTVMQHCALPAFYPKANTACYFDLYRQLAILCWCC